MRLLLTKNPPPPVLLGFQVPSPHTLIRFLDKVGFDMDWTPCDCGFLTSLDVVGLIFMTCASLSKHNHLLGCKETRVCGFRFKIADDKFIMP